MRKSQTLSRLALIGVLALSVGTTSAIAQDANPEKPSQAWEEIREELYGDQTVTDGAGLLTIDAPYRAHDAAIVPIRIDVTPAADEEARKLLLIVDENPMPVAAEMDLGPGLGERFSITTRVRVNAYSNVRAVIEMADGSLRQVARYVKASGGCSAPALKDADQTIASIGKMKLRLFKPEMMALAADDPSVAEAQIMVRHPNYSGFQIDQVTQLHVPAEFVDLLEVIQGEELVFRLTGGISLSEDPSIRFTYLRNGADTLNVNMTDSEDRVFSKSFAIKSHI
ncbi:MAG: quinoprotein dehydrogenase-associated SoxYZ-like carrier [Rhodobacteraceae bacterium]|nr:quinoprotein dehydrogenase-associated SoxYZ-like carrier [Paracoccaceae bacterium]